MQQLSQALDAINSSVGRLEPNKNISNMPQHGLMQEGGRMNTQSIQTRQSNQIQTVTQALEFSSFFLDLVNNSDIDWNGDCIFENGKVIGFATNKTTNHHRMKPIPRGSKSLVEAQQALETLQILMKPATREEFAIAWKKLHLHCGKQNKTPQEISSIISDYYQDLKIYPIKLIEESCEKYRKLPEDNSFMPTSGKLISLLTEKYHRMKFLRTRIDKILGAD